jgi:hypothetical protein
MMQTPKGRMHSLPQHCIGRSKQRLRQLDGGPPPRRDPRIQLPADERGQRLRTDFTQDFVLMTDLTPGHGVRPYKLQQLRQ